MSSSQAPGAPAGSEPRRGRGGASKAQSPKPGNGWTVPDLRWRPVWVGYSIAVAVTAAIGLPLLATRDSTWLLAGVGSVGLLAGGLVAGRGAGPQLALLNGALLAILYNLTVVLAFFIGSFIELLPEPLPGLPQGDSTFFFAWPLAQFVLAILGASVGGRTAAKREKVG